MLPANVIINIVKAQLKNLTFTLKHAVLDFTNQITPAVLNQMLCC